MIGQIAQFHLSVCGTLTSVCSSSQNERFLKLSMFETLKKLESHVAIALCDLRFFGLSNLPHVSIIQQLQTVS